MSALVDFDPASPEFLAKLAWVHTAVPGSVYQQLFGINTNPFDKSVVRTLTYVFTLSHRTAVCDGPAINTNPTSCATGVSGDLGVKNAHGFLTFEQNQRQKRDSLISPVGAPWPEKGAIIFHFNPKVDASEWAEGTTYTGDLDGRQTTWRRVNVVVRPADLTGHGAQLAPAWTLTSE